MYQLVKLSCISRLYLQNLIILELRVLDISFVVYILEEKKKEGNLTNLFS